ncbi:thiamine pyrophosphate-dependent enzyme [candidate division KSB1 bacterium]
MNLSEKRCPRIPDEDYISSGHISCAGCGERLALNYCLKALGKKTVIVVPASCAAVVDGMFPFSATLVPLIHNTFESTAAVATGVKRGLKIRGQDDVEVLAWAGDGGTYDIGLQALSAAAERNEDIIFICYDNEAYMNTGIQRSSATPFKTWTTTTPLQHPKLQPKKDIMEIMAAHAIPYAASASIAFPEDLIEKVEKAKNISGFKFILVFSPCPTGWRYDPEDTIKLARLAVETRIFPLFEVYSGSKYIVSKDYKSSSIEDYFKRQGRFSGINNEEIAVIEQNVEVKWQYLLKKENLFDQL